MDGFTCPKCRAEYKTSDLLASHMEVDREMDPAWVPESVSNVYEDSATPHVRPELQVASNVVVEDKATEGSPAITRFRVWFVLSDNTLHRREIPGNESFRGFCSQLESLHYKPDWTFAIDQFEYILIEKKFHRLETVEPFMGPESYYRMVRQLVEVASHWRHAIVRKRTVNNLCKCLLSAHRLTFSLLDIIVIRSAAYLSRPQPTGGTHFDRLFIRPSLSPSVCRNVTSQTYIFDGQTSKTLSKTSSSAEFDISFVLNPSCNSSGSISHFLK